MKTFRLPTLTALALPLALALGTPTAVSAASLTYTLDQADNMADGAGYVQVTLSDGAAGAVDFAVELLPALGGVLAKNAGLRMFSFNVLPGADAYWKDITGLPQGWKAHQGIETPFGIFDLRVAGKPTDVTDVLRFSITGVASDSIADYVSLSFGPAAEGHSLFAAKLVGVNTEAKDRKTTFGTAAATVVPLPPALWLLGSALGMTLVTARRLRTTQ